MSFVGGPWVVEQSLAKKFQIDTDFPPAIKKLVDAHAAGKSRGKKSIPKEKEPSPDKKASKDKERKANAMLG